MAVRTRDRRAASSVALPTVAVIGRPNVGKSTLFNRIIGRRQAIVAERSGVTRDRQFAEADWGGREFLLADTGGVVEDSRGPMEKEIRAQVVAAIENADAILFVVDGRAGLHPADSHIAALLRKAELPVTLAVNKIDEPVGNSDHVEFYELGLGDPIPMSALGGKGSGDLLDRLIESMPEKGSGDRSPADLNLAIIGKPNVGKSSLVNRLLGEERVIVHDEAGTTRDAIDTYLDVDGERVCLIDTAGLRRRSKVDDNVEFYSRLRAATAIQRADVCLLLIDARDGASNQDFRIGEEAWAAGCGLVFVANKWDLGEDRGPDILAAFERDLRERAAFLRFVPIVTTSAVTGQRVRKLLQIARQVQEQRCRRIATSEVNQVLERLVRRRQPPQGGRGDVRIYYGSQVATSPPTFVLWLNRPHDLAEHYKRYLHNGFREAWGFEGSPLRIRLKKREDTRS